MIIILGIPGVGKTSVLDGLKEYTQVNYGTLMFEIASKEYGLKSRDQLRKLDIAKQKAVQKKVAEKLASMGKVLLDTHCMIRTPSGYLPGLPYSLLKELRVEALVLITASPKEIMGRRSKDVSARERDLISESEIGFEIEISKSYLFSYSVITGAPAKVVPNGDNGLVKAVSEIQSVIGGVWPE